MHCAQRTSNGEASNPSRHAIAADGERTSTRSLEVLVVDDDPITLKLIAAMMGKIGFTVRTAVDGSQAFRNFVRKPCDFVLSDLEMPAVKGDQLGRKIKSGHPGTRVAIMTGLSRVAVSSLMSDGCIDGWLFKPFRLEDLEILLEQIGLSAGGCCRTPTRSIGTGEIVAMDQITVHPKTMMPK
jgi:DNA-binding response OmpR family regulator